VVQARRRRLRGSQLESPAGEHRVINARAQYTYFPIAWTGRIVKHERLPGAGDYYSSPIGGDGKVYLLSQRGHLAVVSAAGERELLQQARFGEGVYATPALVGGHILPLHRRPPVLLRSQAVRVGRVITAVAPGGLSRPAENRPHTYPPNTFAHSVEAELRLSGRR